ncbi:RDD family protein [Photobacterium leiognathi]|uniref:RDD family protein n=1 Tax=Photobacterium leiognathi TaxID=553611 RepID=UPI00298295E8|nr:RDD family protein [Photobacterium leiognathi]
MIDETDYPGFWVRFIANIIDFILLTLVVHLPLGLALGAIGLGAGITNEEFTSPSIVAQLIPMFVTIGLFVTCWSKWQATPGKMVFKLKVVDTKTNEKATALRYLGRYFSYIASNITLGIGYLFIVFRKDKQALHDLISGTRVIYSKK